MTVLDDAALAASDAFIGFGNVLKEQRHIVNVKDYAIGGVVIEDSLIDALAETRRVFIPRDVIIEVTDTIVLNPDAEIYGDGVLVAAPLRPAEWSMFRLTSLFDMRVVIDGVRIDGNLAEQSVQPDGTTSIDAIRIEGSASGVRLNRIRFVDWRYGVTSPANGLFRDRISVTNCTFLGGYGAIGATSWKRSRITRNVCDGQKHFGISVYNARDTDVQHNEILNTGRVNSASAGISASTAQDCDIVGNRIHDVACHGVRLDTNAHRTRVSHNRLTNIGWVNGLIPPGSGGSCGVAAWEGAAGAYSIGVKIDHNVITTVAGYGVSAHYGLVDIYIGGNEISYVGDPGIACAASGRIVANKVKNTDGPGIVLGWDDDNGNANQASGQIVALNDIGPVAMAGIHVNGAQQFAIKDNHIVGAGTNASATQQQRSGIYIAAAHPISNLLTRDGAVRDNIIYGCSAFGIYNAAGPSVSVGPNMLTGNVEGEDWP